MAYTPVTRLHSDAALAAGATVALDDKQAHYLKNVLRLAPGGRIALFNARDGEWWGEIERLGKAGGAARIGERRRAPKAEPDLWLAFAPVKRARIDYLVEKATELGASALLPVYTERTMVERVNLDRLKANAREAAEQTERLSLPEIRAPQALRALIAAWPAGRSLLLCDESGTAPPILEALARRKPGPWAVMIGPEGGFTDMELDLLRNLPFVCAVGLGPRVLRADTAALAALALIQAVLGDWRAGRGA
jgi:16S rRNA (uracil1498-N3)-methyltransferase